MQKNASNILTSHVDIFKKILLYLWKENIKVSNVRTFPQGNSKLKVNFQLQDGNYIQMKLKIEFDKFNCVEKMGLVYEQSIGEEETLFLALSFLYHSPYELELCNQYGLYTKEDVRKMEKAENVSQIQKQRNLLKNNQFYIFNMDKIEVGCSDKVLEQLLLGIHQMCLKINHL